MKPPIINKIKKFVATFSMVSLVIGLVRPLAKDFGTPENEYWWSYIIPFTLTALYFVVRVVPRLTLRLNLKIHSKSNSANYKQGILLVNGSNDSGVIWMVAFTVAILILSGTFFAFFGGILDVIRALLGS